MMLLSENSNSSQRGREICFPSNSDAMSRLSAGPESSLTVQIILESIWREGRCRSLLFCALEIHFASALFAKFLRDFLRLGIEAEKSPIFADRAGVRTSFFQFLFFSFFYLFFPSMRHFICGVILDRLPQWCRRGAPRWWRNKDPVSLPLQPPWDKILVHFTGCAGTQDFLLLFLLPPPPCFLSVLYAKSECTMLEFLLTPPPFPLLLVPLHTPFAGVPKSNSLVSVEVTNCIQTKRNSVTFSLVMF